MEKFYLAIYDNGEDWEDHFSRPDDFIFYNKSECEEYIFGLGYTNVGVHSFGTTYSGEPDECDNSSFYTIKELELIAEYY